MQCPEFGCSANDSLGLACQGRPSLTDQPRKMEIPIRSCRQEVPKLLCHPKLIDLHGTLTSSDQIETACRVAGSVVVRHPSDLDEQ